MKTNEEVWSIVNELKALYPDSLCSLEYEKDYELLFSVRLAAQCTDERVNKVTPALFARFPTLESLAEADVAEVEQYIHSTGFFRAKARDIVLASQMLLRDYGGKVPGTMEELLKLPGVGRKTANLMLGDVFHVPGVVVADTHCIRITGLLGLTDGSKDPAKVEMQLRQVLPPEESNDFCHRMVLHGRAVCIARRPQCESCTCAPGATTSLKTGPGPTHKTITQGEGFLENRKSLGIVLTGHAGAGPGADPEHQGGAGGVPHHLHRLRGVGDLGLELRGHDLPAVLPLCGGAVCAPGEKQPAHRPAPAAPEPGVQPGAEPVQRSHPL